MEMNEILNGLNSCGGNENIAPQCPPNQGSFCGGGTEAAWRRGGRGRRLRDRGRTGRGGEGVVGEAAVVGEIVRTHTGSSGGVERLGRTRAELAHSPPMAVAAADSAETKATGTTKVRGPLGSERRRGRNGWRAQTQMGRPI